MSPPAKPGAYLTELSASNRRRLAQALVRQGKAEDALPHAKLAVEIYSRLGVSSDLEDARASLAESAEYGELRHRILRLMLGIIQRQRQTNPA